MLAAVAPFGGHVVVVDGGSTDGTRSIVADLAREHDACACSTTPRGGRPARSMPLWRPSGTVTRI
jgi:glycosyltransferase involved in cell wall biosynthesis